MPGGERFSLARYPWLRELYEDPAPRTVVMKGGQVGVTELAINRALYACVRLGIQVLYVLPFVNPNASNFSQGRLNPAIRGSPEMVSEAVRVEVDNVGLKRIGNGLLYLRGSDRLHALKEIPVDLLIVDEYDECNLVNLPFAERRLDASPYKWWLYVSNPKWRGYGIDALYRQSDRRRWHAACPKCGDEQVIGFSHIVPAEGGAPARYACERGRCGGTLDPRVGRWIAADPAAKVRGYHVPQYLSPTVGPQEIWEDWQAAKGDPSREQAHHNMRRAEGYSPGGFRISEEQVLRAAAGADWIVPTGGGRRCSMGVDVGAAIHVRISERAAGGQRRAVHIAAVKKFEDLHRLMSAYDVGCCVVDALPETRKAREFAAKFPGRVWLCWYGMGARTPEAAWDDEAGEVTVHRTMAMDAVLTRVQERGLLLPKNAATVEPRNPRTGASLYLEQMTAPVRTVERRTGGQEVAVWIAPEGRADHFFHAETYDELAHRWLEAAPTPPPAKYDRPGRPDRI
jgi:hypothetical protein